MKLPAYEIISGAAIAFAALLLIVPGFATDLIRFFINFSFNKKVNSLEKFPQKFDQKKRPERNHFIDGEFEDIEDDNDQKL